MIMITKTVVEYFKQEDENNTVFELKEKKIVTNSVKILIEGSNEKIETFYVTSTYVILETPIPLGVSIIVEYKVQIEEVVLTPEIRVRQLELQVAELKRDVETLNEALKERVDKHSFRVWIKAIEMKMGISVIDANPHGIDGLNYHEKGY